MTDLSWLKERLPSEDVGDTPNLRAEYALDDATPAVVVRPSEAQAIADTLRWASDQRLAVVPWGGGTQQAAMPAPTRYDVALCTTRLNRVLDYEPAELVITVEAGITLAALSEVLAPQGQFLPITVATPERATIGGLIATNAAGPERLRYGSTRDMVLGVTVALADGSLIRGGGRVVKNVAGYDLTRLFNGSWGTLGVITAASLRLYPIPPVRRTVAVRCTSWAEAQTIALRLHSSRLGPQGLTIAPIDTEEAGVPPVDLFVRFGGPPATVERQIAETQAMASAEGAQADRILEGDQEETLWRHLADPSLHAPGVHLQANVLPSRVVEAVRTLTTVAEVHGWPSRSWAHVGAGTVLTVWDAPPDPSLAGAVHSARERITTMGGWLFVRQAPRRSPSLDYWGTTTEGALPLMRGIKAKLDPAGILNPGRFIV